MSVVTESEIKWSSDQMVEISLNEPDDFLKVRETLTRIGVASRKEKKIYQSCHILHKQGRYFLVHFKELFALDGKHANLTSNDVQRRNRIAQLLSDWGLVEVLNTDQKTILHIPNVNTGESTKAKDEEVGKIIDIIGEAAVSCSRIRLPRKGYGVDGVDLQSSRSSSQPMYCGRGVGPRFQRSGSR